MNIVTNYYLRGYNSNYGLRDKTEISQPAETKSPAFKMNKKIDQKTISGLATGIAGLFVGNQLAQRNINPTDTKKCNIPFSMPQTKSQINDVSVTVVGGDMTLIDADVYVVPQFNSCASEGGVGGAIARRGAIKGMNEYNEYIDKNGKLDWSNVVLTESGGGKAKYLVHAVTVGADRDSSFEVVQKAVYNALNIAQQQGLQSVVIPAMGTGIIGTLTDVQSANAIMAGINQFANEGGKMDVSVVVYSQGKEFNDFSEVLTSKSYVNAAPVTGTKEFNMGAFIREIEQTEELNKSEVAVKKDVAITELETSAKKPVLSQEIKNTINQSGNYVAYEKQTHPNGNYSLYARDENGCIIGDHYQKGEYSHSTPYKKDGYGIVEGKDTKIDKWDF